MPATLLATVSPPAHIIPPGTVDGGAAHACHSRNLPARMRTRARTRTQAPGPLQVTMHCNDRKYAAKEAQEGSSKVFLCCLLKEKPMPMRALIKSVGRKFLEAPALIFILLHYIIYWHCGLVSPFHFKG